MLLLLRGDVIGVHDYPAAHFYNLEPAVSVRSERASKSIRDGVRTWRSILKFWGAKAVLISSYCCKEYCHAFSSAMYAWTEPVSVLPKPVGERHMLGESFSRPIRDQPHIKFIRCKARQAMQIFIRCLPPS